MKFGQSIATIMFIMTTVTLNNIFSVNEFWVNNPFILLLVWYISLLVYM